MKFEGSVTESSSQHCTRVCAHALLNTYIYTQEHARARTYTHTRARARTNTHTNTHRSINHKGFSHFCLTICRQSLHTNCTINAHHVLSMHLLQIYQFCKTEILLFLSTLHISPCSVASHPLSYFLLQICVLRIKLAVFTPCSPTCREKYISLPFLYLASLHSFIPILVTKYTSLRFRPILVLLSASFTQL